MGPIEPPKISADKIAILEAAKLRLSGPGSGPAEDVRTYAIILNSLLRACTCREGDSEYRTLAKRLREPIKNPPKYKTPPKFIVFLSQELSTALQKSPSQRTDAERELIRWVGERMTNQRRVTALSMYQNWENYKTKMGQSSSFTNLLRRGVPPSDFKKKYYPDGNPLLPAGGVSALNQFAAAVGAGITGVAAGAAGFAVVASGAISGALATNAAIAALGSSASTVSVGGTAAGFIAGPLIVAVAAAAILGTQIRAVLEYDSFDQNVALMWRTGGGPPVDLTNATSESDRNAAAGFLISMILTGAGSQRL